MEEVKYKKEPVKALFLNGGGIGIRTLGTLARTTVFKTAPINHSGIPPSNCSDVIKLYLLNRICQGCFRGRNAKHLKRIYVAIDTIIIDKICDIYAFGNIYFIKRSSTTRFSR